MCMRCHLSVVCWGLPSCLSSHPPPFCLCSTEASRTIAEEAQLFKITVSFGSVSSLISLPCYMSHASIPAEVRAARGLPDDLVRISVGIEEPEDLLQGEHTRNLIQDLHEHQCTLITPAV